ncbi:MAG TPA: sigma-70 family RNA polymerase sigma factor [Phycisphaerae bacterium]|nr:sigma-70 family RNA polymerase sigma factor [Phycisphaerae bacterium]
MYRSAPRSRIQTLPDDEVQHLWECFFVSRDEAIRNRLLVHYLPLARGIARHVHARLPLGADFEDIAQAAALGMRDAIATYRPELGIKFEHYCGRRVRGAALDFLRSQDWAPRTLRSRMQRVNEMATQLEMQTGSLPSDESLSEALGMPLDELQSTRRESAAPLRVRLVADEEMGDGSSSGGHRGGSGVSLNAIPDTNAVDPELEAQRADLREFITKGLSVTQRRVIMLYYYENMSFREIGETLNLCESRVSQIHQAVLSRLRERGDRFGETP